MDRTRVTLAIPAIAMNLGAGYATLGLALSLRNEFTVEQTDEGFQVTNLGFYGRDVPVSAANLVVRAARRLFERVGYRADAYRVGVKELWTLKSPGIALVQIGAYKHFRSERRVALV